jgi:hypothetical protein
VGSVIADVCPCGSMLPQAASRIVSRTSVPLDSLTLPPTYLCNKLGLSLRPPPLSRIGSALSSLISGEKDHAKSQARNLESL